MLKKFFTKKSNQKILLFVGLTVAASFLVGNLAHASLLGDAVAQLLCWIIYGIIWCLGQLLTLIMWILITIAQYNDFINGAPIVYGWAIVRDVCNMFFILILLLIAFGTILRLPQYNLKSSLKDLIMMAILINFSKIICGFIIDFAQVIMLTFVNGFKDAGQGNLFNMLGIEGILDVNDTSMGSDGEISSWSILGTYILALIFVVVALVTITTMTVMLAMRIIMMWIYVVLSPLAYLLSAFPQGKSYASQWWEKFSKNVIVGPVMAFFIWLAFASLGGTETPDVDKIAASNAKSSTTPETTLGTDTGAGTAVPSAGISKAGSPDHMIKFIISIAMLMGGLQISQEIGGEAGAVAGKGMAQLSKLKAGALRVGKRVTIGAAKRAATGAIGVAGASLKGAGALVGGQNTLVGRGLQSAGAIGTGWRKDLVSARKQRGVAARQKFFQKIGMGENAAKAGADFTTKLGNRLNIAKMRTQKGNSEINQGNELIARGQAYKEQARAHYTEEANEERNSAATKATQADEKDVAADFLRETEEKNERWNNRPQGATSTADFASEAEYNQWKATEFKNVRENAGLDENASHDDAITRAAQLKVEASDLRSDSQNSAANAESLDFQASLSGEELAQFGENLKDANFNVTAQVEAGSAMQKQGQEYKDRGERLNKNEDMRERWMNRKPGEKGTVDFANEAAFKNWHDTEYVNTKKDAKLDPEASGSTVREKANSLIIGGERDMRVGTFSVRQAQEIGKIRAANNTGDSEKDQANINRIADRAIDRGHEGDKSISEGEALIDRGKSKVNRWSTGAFGKSASWISNQVEAHTLPTSKAAFKKMAKDRLSAEEDVKLAGADDKWLGSTSDSFHYSASGLNSTQKTRLDAFSKNSGASNKLASQVEALYAAPPTAKNDGILKNLAQALASYGAQNDLGSLSAVKAALAGKKSKIDGTTSFNVDDYKDKVKTNYRSVDQDWHVASGTGGVEAGTFAKNSSKAPAERNEERDLMGVSFGKLQAKAKEMNVDVALDDNLAVIKQGDLANISKVLSGIIADEISSIKAVNPNDGRLASLQTAKTRLDSGDDRPAKMMLKNTDATYIGNPEKSRKENYESVAHEQIHSAGVMDEDLTKSISKVLMDSGLHGSYAKKDATGNYQYAKNADGSDAYRTNAKGEQVRVKEMGNHTTEIGQMAAALKNQGLSNAEIVNRISEEAKRRSGSPAEKVLAYASGDRQTINQYIQNTNVQNITNQTTGGGVDMGKIEAAMEDAVKPVIKAVDKDAGKTQKEVKTTAKKTGAILDNIKKKL